VALPASAGQLSSRPLGRQRVGPFIAEGMRQVKGKAGLVVAVALTALALVIGLFGIAVLIGVGEGANNAIAAFAAVSFPFAILAGFFSWIAPQARWPIAAAMSGPVALISLAGSWSGGIMLLGAILTVAFTCGGAYAGAQLRRSRSRGQQPPL